MPNPTNPITGDAAYLYPPKKRYTRFTLLETLSTSDEVKTASITDQDTWSNDPIFHPTGVNIRVHNQMTKVNGVYQFYGAVGDVGIALFDANIEWRIISMFQGGLIGGCLDEDHPGRGVAFDIHLGTWNPDTDGWDYDLTAVVKAIDHRYGVPYPDAGSTGLFEARASTAYGVIMETVALDCTSPGACS